MPARNITLQFGLLSVQAKLSSAVQAKTSNANMCVGQPGHDTHTATPVGQPKVCALCGEITDYNALVKGVRQGDTYAILTQEQVEDAKAEFASEHKGVVNLLPHPAGEVLSQTAPGDKVSYIVPKDATATKHYNLLLKLVREHPEYVLTSLYTPVSVTGLYVVQERAGALVLVERSRTQDLKEAPVISTDMGEKADQLYPLLEQLLVSTAVPYNPEDYEDKYAAAITGMVASADTVTLVVSSSTKPAAPVGDVDDLIAKLQALVA